MKYPINYDFSAKWKSEIVPHLSNPIIQKAIEEGVNGYCSMYPNSERYKQNTAPANYSSRDAYATLTDKKWEIMYKDLKKKKLVPKEILDLEAKIATADDCDIDDIGYDLMGLEIKFMEEFFTWDKIKDDLETYWLVGACHWWAATFLLELAKLVDPREQWHVVESDIHSTVINNENTKVFDLLYWAVDDRIEDYVLGRKRNEKDPTLGGEQAYIDTVQEKIKMKRKIKKMKKRENKKKT